MTQDDLDLVIEKHGEHENYELILSDNNLDEDCLVNTHWVN